MWSAVPHPEPFYDLYPGFFPSVGEWCSLQFPVRLLMGVWVISGERDDGGKSAATVKSFPGSRPQALPYHCPGASSEGHLRLAPPETEAGPTPSDASRQFVQVTCLCHLPLPFCLGDLEGTALHAQTGALRAESAPIWYWGAPCSLHHIQ